MLKNEGCLAGKIRFEVHAQSMKKIQSFPFFALFFFTSFLLASLFAFRSPSTELSKKAEIAQNTYLGPISPVPGNPQLIRVEIIVNDDPELGGFQMQEVKFNGTQIPLKPRDINGFRGQASFQLPPGNYKLNWKLNRDKYVWPRTVSHEQIVHLNARDLWVQITIQGEEASIR